MTLTSIKRLEDCWIKNDITRGASLGGEYYATQGNYIRLTSGNFDYRNNCLKENQSKDNIYYVGDFNEEFLLGKVSNHAFTY